MQISGYREMHSNVLFVWFWTLNEWFSHTHAYDIHISPLYIKGRNMTGYNIVCEARNGDAPVALTGCQFLHQTMLGEKSSIMDFSNGSSTRLPDGSTYQGTGLQNGSCGITLGVSYDSGVFGCRVREATGRWHYQMIMYFNFSLIIWKFTLQPSLAYAKAGSRVDLAWTAKHEILQCAFYRSSDNLYMYFNEGRRSRSTSAYQYYWTDLSAGQCGVSLLDVTGKDISFVYGWITSVIVPSAIAVRMATVIVYTPPDKPTLTVTSSDLMEGEMLLNATCVVSNSRPVSNITWLLGDRVVREDDLTNEAPAETDWLWSYELQSITQHLLLNVTLEDNGKQLVCRASHVALESRWIESRYVIHFKVGWMTFSIAGVFFLFLPVASVAFLWVKKLWCWAE